jgi:hypothetical protein
MWYKSYIKLVSEVVSMQRKYLSLVLIFALIFVIGFSGCSRNTKGDNKIPGTNNELLECNWVMKVDQTVQRKYDDGMTVEHTLVLIAEKNGGTDVSGTYNGALYLGSKLDISEFSNEIVDMSGGFDVHAFGNNLTFDVVSFELDKYTGYGKKEGDLGIPPLVEYESMATFTQEMTGTGVLNPYIKGKPAGSVSGGINETGSGSAPVPIRIAIISGKVRVDFPTLDIGKSFEGQLLGVPIGDSKQYDETMDKIEELKEKTEGNNDGPSKDEGDLGDLGGLGGIMGQMGTNLRMPDSFPSDEIPVMPDVSIINVYENDTKKNVRIMFGTDKEYEEVLDFYEEEFISKLEDEPTKIDVDGGIMYMCKSEGYKNITIMIMEDPSKTYKSMVMLEVLKK